MNPAWARAAKSGDLEAARLFLHSGGDINAPDRYGQTALMIVARAGRVDAARLLLDHGANVNAVEKWRGQTALMWAAAQGQADMVRALIAAGADVNARATVNDWGRQVTAEPRAIYRPAGGLTPLLYAAREGCVDCAAALVEGGAAKRAARSSSRLPLPFGCTSHASPGALQLAWLYTPDMGTAEVAVDGKTVAIISPDQHREDSDVQFLKLPIDGELASLEVTVRAPDPPSARGKKKKAAHADAEPAGELEIDEESAVGPVHLLSVVEERERPGIVLVPRPQRIGAAEAAEVTRAEDAHIERSTVEQV